LMVFFEVDDESSSGIVAKRLEAAMASFWTSKEIDVSQEKRDYSEYLTPRSRHIADTTLAYFLLGDGLVLHNLIERFQKEIAYLPSNKYLAFQIVTEYVHVDVYVILFRAIHPELSEALDVLNVVRKYPSVAKKINWGRRWFETKNVPFRKRLVAFVCVERLNFCGPFFYIFWIAKTYPGRMSGLTKSNESISRDETDHGAHGKDLHSLLNKRCSREEFVEIVSSCVETEISANVDILSPFQTDPELIKDESTARDLTIENVVRFIRFMANGVCSDFGFEPIYEDAIELPEVFSWFHGISMNGVTNFFEQRVSEYKRMAVHDGDACRGIEGLVPTFEVRT